MANCIKECNFNITAFVGFTVWIVCYWRDRTVFCVTGGTGRRSVFWRQSAVCCSAELDLVSRSGNMYPVLWSQGANIRGEKLPNWHLRRGETWTAELTCRSDVGSRETGVYLDGLVVGTDLHTQSAQKDSTLIIWRKEKKRDLYWQDFIFSERLHPTFPTSTLPFPHPQSQPSSLVSIRKVAVSR